MSKTAEEILVDKKVLRSTDLSTKWNFEITRDTGMASAKWLVEAMHDFAAQEVEEYKERLKDGIDNIYPNAHQLFEISILEVKTIIDTVK